MDFNRKKANILPWGKIHFQQKGTLFALVRNERTTGDSLNQGLMRGKTE
jgi:hypothetical protein